MGYVSQPFSPPHILARGSPQNQRHARASRLLSVVSCAPYTPHRPGRSFCHAAVRAGNPVEPQMIRQTPYELTFGIARVFSVREDSNTCDHDLRVNPRGHKCWTKGRTTVSKAPHVRNTQPPASGRRCLMAKVSPPLLRVLLPTSLKTTWKHGPQWISVTTVQRAGAVRSCQPSVRGSSTTVNSGGGPEVPGPTLGNVPI